VAETVEETTVEETLGQLAEAGWLIAMTTIGTPAARVEAQAAGAR
jgi:hypothetical protein